MKSGALLKAFALGGLLALGAVGHPFNAKRAVVTEVVFVTETVADAVVYVDETGSPYTTSTISRSTSISTTVVEPTSAAVSSSASPAPVFAESAPAPAPLASTASALSASPFSSEATSSVLIQHVETTSIPASFPPEPTSAPAQTSAPAPAPVSSSQEPASSPASPPAEVQSVNSDDSFPLGITYDPYKGTANQVACKTGDEIARDFGKMKEFRIIRIYGDDCGQIPVAVQQAKINGQVLMAGIYTPNQSIDQVVKALSDAINRYNGGNWDIIKVVSVENERINARVITASDAQDSIAQARDALGSVGYRGPVGAVETAPAIIDNPAVCAKSDLTLVNIHAFFDPHTKAEDAGKFVKSEVERVKKACPGKRVVVTESGWPHQGDNHDQAVASPSAQKAAIASIRASFTQDLFLFNAFDSEWKTDDASTFNSEKYWGVLS